MARAHVLIHGKVQGVFFRASTRDKARDSEVKGWVRNCMNGRVEAVFEGERDAVNQVIEWCKKGPDGAFVQKVDVCWEEFLGEFDEFSIVY